MMTQIHSGNKNAVLVPAKIDRGGEMARTHLDTAAKQAVNHRPLCVEDFAALTFGCQPLPSLMPHVGLEGYAAPDRKALETALILFRRNDNGVTSLVRSLGFQEAAELSGALLERRDFHRAFAQTMEAAWTRAATGICRCGLAGVRGF